MKKLIISYDTYSWIKYVGGMIIENPDMYRVIIVCEDADRDMDCCNFLCEDAIYSQRRYDIFNIAKKMGLKSVSNFNYNYLTLLSNLPRFSSEIAILMITSGIDTILYQNNYIIRNIIKNIKGSAIKRFSFGSKNTFDNTKFIYLKSDTVDKKITLAKYMIGVHDKQEKKLFPSVEQLYF